MNSMGDRFFRIVEIVFTAYAVPALIVPFVWLGRKLFTAWGQRTSGSARKALNRMFVAYISVASVWFAVWVALRLGVPIEKGGRAAGALLWLAYGLVNLLLAWLLVRFTGGYGELPEGRTKDRLFLQLLLVVVAQPLMTACAFPVLYRIMGVVYHLSVPGLTAVQEGI